MILDKIEKTNDIKKIKPEDYPLLAEEIREFIIQKVSEHGGHLASNLGVVELTMALHVVFNPEKDRIIWDVGHQSYTHKILTGRKKDFDHLRELGGMSGFPKRSESICDAFDTGHSSTSISAGLGLTAARNLKGDNYHIISVIGDGALTGGMAFEALNNASKLKKLNKNFIIILNDNEMSISHNVGGMSSYLDNIRTADKYQDLKADIVGALNKIPVYGEKAVSRIRKAKNSIKQLLIPGMLFEDMGITYLGPVDGHDTELLIETLKGATRVQGPVLVHVITKKGKGYEAAEKHPGKFHGVGKFDIETAKPVKSKDKADYQDILSSEICSIAEKNDKVIAITAAMESGTGLKKFHKLYPDRFFDVGIAEGHAVTFSAGMAAGGLIPVFAVYSSFLQRGYDQIVHDVCMQNLHTVFCIDRAGLVGNDGMTHHGAFDISFLITAPNMTVMAPKNKWELRKMLRFAIDEMDSPVAIRYPRGTAYDGLESFDTPIELGKPELIHKGEGVIIIALGNMVKTAEKVVAILSQFGVNATLLNARFAKPLNLYEYKKYLSESRFVVTLEEGDICGGFGRYLSGELMEEGVSVKIMNIGLPDSFVEHGSVDSLYDKCALTPEKITERIVERIKKEYS